MTAQLSLPGASTSPRPRHGTRRRKGRSKRRLLRVALVLLLILVAAAAWIIYTGLRAKDDLQRAAADVATLQAQAESGNVAAERISVASLQREAHSARVETSGPIWEFARWTPGVGSNAAAITTVASAVDDLAQRALPSLVDTSATVDLHALAPHDGRIDLVSIQRAAPATVEAASAMQRVRDQVAGISTSGLMPVVRTSVLQLRSDLDAAATTTSTAARAMALLPPMLGASQPRTYAVLFQNNAELRATGGIPGSWAIMRIDHGAVQIVKQGSAGDVDSRLTGVPVPPDVAALYTNRPGIFFQDVDMAPSFPTDATIASEMFEQAYGIQLDGVISTDPVALAGLLKATGPVQLPQGGSLTATDAVPLLLSQVYQNIQNPTQQDLFFAQAANAVFAALTAGQGDAGATVKALADAASAGRLTVWSAHPGEEQLLAGTELAGTLPVNDQTGSPTVGVFLNDGTGAKLDYYLHEDVAVRSAASCPASRIGFHVLVTLTSTVPANAKKLPAYVTGSPKPGVTLGTMETQIDVAAPIGGSIESAMIDGVRSPIGTGTDSGRSDGLVFVDLAPGQTKTIDIQLTTSDLPSDIRAHGLDPRLLLTPLAAPALLHLAHISCPND
jgi:cell division protein FtsB